MLGIYSQCYSVTILDLSSTAKKTFISLFFLFLSLHLLYQDKQQYKSFAKCLVMLHTNVAERFHSSGGNKLLFLEYTQALASSMVYDLVVHITYPV